MGKQICTPRIYCIVLFLAVGMFLGGTPGRAQTIPPSGLPVGLTATATSCGQVNLPGILPLTTAVPAQGLYDHTQR